MLNMIIEGGGGTTFPVVFFDGEKEINIGSFRIEPKQVYKDFQFMIAQEIGISPNQISIYLVNRDNPKSPENRRKFPITAKANFAQICKEKDCCFLVVLKRSRKGRTRKPVTPLYGDFEDDFTAALPRFMPENVVLLRRDQPPLPPPPPPPPIYDHMDFMMAQHYMNPYFPRMEAVFPRYYCEECTTAEKNGKPPDFHHCVNDVVVKEFRAAGAGPIGPIRR